MSFLGDADCESPHAWGLITFIEPIKKVRYNFWEHEFVQYIPNIEK